MMSKGNLIVMLIAYINLLNVLRIQTATIVTNGAK